MAIFQLCARLLLRRAFEVLPFGSITMNPPKTVAIYQRSLYQKNPRAVNKIIAQKKISPRLRVHILEK